MKYQYRIIEHDKFTGRDTTVAHYSDIDLAMREVDAIRSAMSPRHRVRYGHEVVKEEVRRG